MSEDQTVTVYKVKDDATGLFMTKNGGWNKKGRTWESLGMLKMSMNGLGFWNKDPNYPGCRSTEIFGDAVKIIEIKIVQTEDNTSPLDDFVETQRRYASLGHKYGYSFRELVERIEKQGQNEQFQWVLAAKGGWDYNNQHHTGAFDEMLEIVKSLKLKQNKDYKKASNAGAGGVIAFASKIDAMKVRLIMREPCQGIDIKDFIETNLDDEVDSTV